MGNERDQHRGLLITLEGIEGSGKTSQCARLAKRLREKNFLVVETREPGGTPLAEQIRTLLLAVPPTQGCYEPMLPACEALLLLACRSQHVAKLIRPALYEGAVVLCDRFFDSTLAYQGYGRGLDLQALRTLNRFATEGLTPNLTLLFDIPVTTGLSRRHSHEQQCGTARNRIDRESRCFHERVRRGFLELAAEDPNRIKVVDGRPDPEIVSDHVTSLVHIFLSTQPKRQLKAGHHRALRRYHRT